MIKGECFCGAIKYEIDSALTHARACHCSRCRKVFGGASSAFAEIVDASKFRWTAGEERLAQYSSENELELGFCGVCGSALCGLYKGAVMGVTLGTVNGDPRIVIEKHIFVGSKAPWDHIGGSAEQFEEWG